MFGQNTVISLSYRVSLNHSLPSAILKAHCAASSGSEVIRPNLTPHMKFEGKDAQRLKLS